eukprot:NODE_2169_length_1272_cov_89.731807_g1973_i0.p1 GENE.NODE_2169_length_1272_cov_89.731807_g1973_i0~~NODE_2169_length_1272_cov_89.731807_g1973_i0.p1  ORF type:complete len:199 (+),score=40.33 NODE_2169_length_1272_cov_89.731807_g1973_i0:507-1103(+)
MLDGDWEEFATDESDGTYTIKHPAALFPLILQMLNGVYDFPFSEPASLMHVLQEVEFYGLQKVREELLVHYPWLDSSAVRLDGIYFSIRTPIVSGLAPKEFNFVSPDSLIRALRFKPGSAVHRYKRVERSNTVSMQYDGSGTYEMLPMNRILCKFPDLTCFMATDAQGTLVLEYKNKVSKVVFQSDDEMVSWLKIPVL